MPALEGTGNANPLDAGASPNSVEASADDFTRMLEQETAPDKDRSRQSSDTRKPSPRNADPEPQANGRGAAPSDDEPRPDPEDDLLTDDILDAPAPKKDGDPEDDNDGTDPDDSEPAEGEEGDDDEPEALSLDEIDADVLADKEFEVVVNGETQAVPFKEILKGYTREADYRQKTARLSEEKREVEQFAETVVQQRTRYDAAIQEIEDLSKTFRPSDEDWQKLKASNLPLYIESKEQWDALDKKLGDLKGEREKISNEAAQQAQAQYNSYVREHNDKLFEKVPALRNPEKAKQFRATLLNTGKKMGYTAEELTNGLIDHRDILTMYYAGKFLELRESRQKQQGAGKGEGKGGKRRAAPKPQPSSQPRQIARRQGDGGRVRDAEGRLARTGSVDDAAAAFTSLINSGRI